MDNIASLFAHRMESEKGRTFFPSIWTLPRLLLHTILFKAVCNIYVLVYSVLLEARSE